MIPSKSSSQKGIIFPEYVANKEEPEIIDKIKDQMLIEHEQDGKKVKINFGDFFGCMQAFNLSEAYIFAGENFRTRIQTPEKIELFIKSIHEIASRHLMMLDDAPIKLTGEYRKAPSSTIDTNKPMGVAVNAIPQEMKIFCEKLSGSLQKQGGEVKSQEAIEIATFALTEIGRIHPFTNGNGRTARIIMNSILVHFGLSPIIFEKKEEYYSCFEKYQSNPNDLNKLIKQALEAAETYQYEKMTSPIKAFILRNTYTMFDTPIKVIDVEAGYGPELDKVFVNYYLEKCKNEYAKAFFKNFYNHYYSTNNNTPSSISSKLLTGSPLFSSSSVTNLKTLENETETFFKQLNAKWKKYPTDKLIGRYIGHDVSFFTMPSETTKEQTKVFTEHLKLIGFDAETKETKTNSFIVVDLTTSKLAL